jgi:hypothetical protein
MSKSYNPPPADSLPDFASQTKRSLLAFDQLAHGQLSKCHTCRNAGQWTFDHIKLSRSLRDQD